MTPYPTLIDCQPLMQPVKQIHVQLSFIQHQKSLTWLCFSQFKLNSYPLRRFYAYIASILHLLVAGLGVEPSIANSLWGWHDNSVSLTRIIFCNCHLVLCTSWSQLASAPSNLPCTPDLVGTWRSAVGHLCVLRSDALSSPLNWIYIPTSNMIYEAVRNGTMSFDTH